MGSFSLFHWMIFAGIVFILYSIFKNNSGGAWRAPPPSSTAQGEATPRLPYNAVHCMTCGVDAPPRTRTRGSMGVEIILWICFIVPGLIYSVWRLSSRGQVCSACGASNIIPPNSPAAVSHRRAMAPPQVSA